MLAPSRTTKPLELGIVFLIYGLLGLLSMIWDWLSRGHPFYAWIESSSIGFAGLIGATAIIAAYLAFSFIMNKIFRWARQLENLFAQLLTPISYFQIAVISLLSGFMEEWFFRGVLLAHFGPIISSLVFGLCHLIPERGLWVWSLWSFLAGIAFALILQITGSLWLCAMVHAGINASVLVVLNHKVLNRPQMHQEV